MKIIVALMVMLIMTGCASIHHVPPKRFQLEANMMQSFYWCEYIGQADGKAYLLRKRAPLIGKKWKEEIFFTDVNGLSADYIKELEGIKARRISNKTKEAIASSAVEPAQPHR